MSAKLSAKDNVCLKEKLYCLGSGKNSFFFYLFDFIATNPSIFLTIFMFDIFDGE